jgi:hypothetical protein
MKRLILFSLLLVSAFVAQAQRLVYSKPSLSGASNFQALLSTDIPSNFLRSNATNTLSGDIMIDGAHNFDIGTPFTSTVTRFRVIVPNTGSAGMYNLSGYGIGITSGGLQLIPAGTFSTGGILYKNSGGYMVPLNPGSNGNVLTLSSGIPSWAAPTGGTWGSITGTLSSQTDLQTALNGKQTLDADLTTLAGIPVGSGIANYAVVLDGSGTGYTTSPRFPNPATTNGDLLYYTGSAFSRLGIGSSGQVLTVSSGLPSWQTASSGFADPMTTIGDIIIRNGSNVTARLGIGATGTVLKGGTTPTYAAVDLTADVGSSVLPKANGGTGTASPGLVAGTNVSITGTWPNQTINSTGSGSGSVTDVSIVSANGFAGSVATSTSTPAITLSTSITGVLKGNGTAISAATSGTDYQAPLVSGTNIKTINSTTVLGSGNFDLVDFSNNQTSIGGNKSWTGLHTITNSGADPLKLVRTSNFSTTQTMLSALNNTSTEVFKLSSNGVGLFSFYSTAGAAGGTIQLTPLASNPAILFSGTTTNYRFVHDQTNDAMLLYNNLTTSKIMLGANATPTATLQVRGRATTTGALFRLEDSGGTARMTMSDAGTTILSTLAATGQRLVFAKSTGEITSDTDLTYDESSNNLVVGSVQTSGAMNANSLIVVGSSSMGAVTASSVGSTSMTSDSYAIGSKAFVGGSFMDSYTDANNSGTTETDLHSYTTPAFFFAANHEKGDFEYSGTFSDATSTATLKVYFDGQLIASSGAVTVSATGVWTATGYIVRTSSTTARAYVTYTVPFAGFTAGQSMTTITDLTSLTLGDTSILKITGQAGGGGGGSNDITLKTAFGRWYPAN